MNPPNKNHGVSYYLPHLAVLLGILVTLVAYYPGIMSFDAGVQLEQARSGLYTDNHPPIMAGLWSLLDKLILGSGGMFLFHILLFWTGLGLFTSLHLSNRWLAALIILFLGFFPSVLGPLPTISKDISLGASLVSVCALLALAFKLYKVFPLLMALPFFFYASSVRHNSAFALIPLLIWGAIVLYKIKTPRGFKLGPFVIFATLVGFFSLQGITRLTNHLLIGGKSSFLVQHVFLFDLVGISLLKQEVTLPPYLNRPENPWTLEDLKRIYNESVSDTLFQGKDPPRRFSYSQDRTEIRELTRYWFAAVTSNFGAYLSHRWSNFKNLIALSRPAVCNPLGTAASYSPLHKNWLNERVIFFLKSISNSIFFRGWVYLSVAAFLFVYSLLLKSAEAAFISLSGLLHGSFYFIVSPSCHFRYLWWTALSTLLTAIVLGGHIHLKIRDFRPHGKV